MRGLTPREFELLHLHLSNAVIQDTTIGDEIRRDSEPLVERGLVEHWVESYEEGEYTVEHSCWRTTELGRMVMDLVILATS